MADRNRTARTAAGGLALAVTLIAALHGGPWGATAAVEVTARVMPANTRVGEPVRYEIAVTRSAGARIVLPAVKGNTGRLEVLGHEAHDTTLADGREVTTHALTLVAWSVGADTLPPQRIEVRLPPDTASIVLYTQPTLVTVSATVDTLDTAATQFADIHDTERLPRGFPWWLVLLTGAGAAAVWWIRKRRNRPRPEIPAAPARVAPAAARALARLDAREAAGHLDAGKTTDGARLFAFKLSEILREYLAARFGIDALEATTAELLERAAPLPLPPAAFDWLRAASEELDVTKFATGTLSPEAGARLLGGVRAFIHEVDGASTVKTESAADTPPAPSGNDAP